VGRYLRVHRPLLQRPLWGTDTGNGRGLQGKEVEIRCSVCVHLGNRNRQRENVEAGCKYLLVLRVHLHRQTTHKQHFALLIGVIIKSFNALLQAKMRCCKGGLTAQGAEKTQAPRKGVIQRNPHEVKGRFFRLGAGDQMCKSLLWSMMLQATM
jgi:hypothetical protein